MKYIDTRAQGALRQGVMKFLSLSEEDITKIFMSEDMGNEPQEWVRNFILDTIDEPLEFIQMFHLSRRLNGIDLKVTRNLKQLLLEDSPLSEFFRKYRVIFKLNVNHIDLYYKGELKLNNDELRHHDNNVCYIKSRLGYYKDKDYCVNGFAFRSYLEKNPYYILLSHCPEFVDKIEQFLGIEGMGNDYRNNSKYYCIEYLIPISEVIFDMESPPETDYEKTVELLCQAVLRLYYEWLGNNMMCYENLILRLSDNAMINAEYFVNAEEFLI